RLRPDHRTAGLAPGRSVPRRPPPGLRVARVLPVGILAAPAAIQLRRRRVPPVRHRALDLARRRVPLREASRPHLLRERIMNLLRILSAGLVLAAGAAGQDRPINVVATVPDLGHLVSEIGGSEVAVTVLAKPTEDPHFVEAKPSFIKTMSTAELLVLTGMELE